MSSFTATNADPSTFLSRFLDSYGGHAVVDGGLATELQLHGADLNDPLCSAICLLTSPDLIRRVHLDYLEAGASIIISNSYQATIEGFEAKGLSRAEGENLLRKSVEIAREARDIYNKTESSTKQPILVAASIGSYGAYLADGSEYSGDYGESVTLEALKNFHRRRLQVLVESGPDLIAFETIPNKLEAKAYSELLEEEGIKLPVWFTFSCKDNENVVNGDPILDCASIANSCKNVAAIGVNCTPPKFVHELILTIRKATNKPIVVYPFTLNNGETYDALTKQWVPTDGGITDEEFVSYVAKWLEAGASFIGGCCKTTPNTIRAIAKTLATKSAQPTQTDNRSWRQNYTTQSIKMGSFTAAADPSTFLSRFLEIYGGYAAVDGGLATELERHGADLNDPLWSAKCLVSSPHLIRRVHLDYLEAGASIIISASYQATIQGFEAKGFYIAEGESLLRKSVEIAREARDIYNEKCTKGSYDDYAQTEISRTRPILVAASIGSYGAYLADGSEYSGDYGESVTLETLKNFHRRRLQVLVDSGPDLIAFETIPNKLEAKAFSELLEEEEIELPVWFTFSCKDSENVVSGDPVYDCALVADSCKNVAAVGVNCTPPRYVHGLILSIKKATNKPIMIYPNSGETYDAVKKQWERTSGVSDEEDFVSYVAKWLEAGASLVGGCCRTTPNTIKSIAKTLPTRSAQST